MRKSARYKSLDAAENLLVARQSLQAIDWLHHRAEPVLDAEVCVPTSKPGACAKPASSASFVTIAGRWQRPWRHQGRMLSSPESARCKRCALRAVECGSTRLRPGCAVDANLHDVCGIVAQRHHMSWRKLWMAVPAGAMRRSVSATCAAIKTLQRCFAGAAMPPICLPGGIRAES